MHTIEILSAIILGALAGSFLSTVAIRWPSPGSLGGRSRCDECGVAVPAYDNLPIAGFILLRGRCRGCGARIDFGHLALEVVCAAAGGIALALRPGTSGWTIAALGWALALLALIDAREQRLPDILVFPLGAAGLALGAMWSPLVLETRAIGAVAGFLALRVVAHGYRAARGREGIGGGDAKLLGAIGAWTGWQPLPTIVLVSSLLGLSWAAFQHLRGQRITMVDRLPFGTLLAIAAWGVVMLAPG